MKQLKKKQISKKESKTRYITLLLNCFTSFVDKLLSDFLIMYKEQITIDSELKPFDLYCFTKLIQFEYELLIVNSETRELIKDIPKQDKHHKEEEDNEEDNEKTEEVTEEDNEKTEKKVLLLMYFPEENQYERIVKESYLLLENYEKNKEYIVRSTKKNLYRYFYFERDYFFVRDHLLSDSR